MIAMYGDGIGFKQIAKRLVISPRITREILIKRGHWKPDPRRNGVARKGLGGLVISAMTGEHTRNKLALIRLTRRMDKALRLARRRAEPKHSMSDAQRYKLRYDNDPAFRMVQLMRQRMRKVMTGAHISLRQLSMLGCTRAEFVAHIEKQFKRGMTWQNMGTGQGKWHLDHITPCAAFDQTSASQRATCWHFTNFQPMWSIENIKKGARIDYRNAQLGLPL